MMKKIVVFLTLVTLMSCSNKNSRLCDNSALYGYVTICLPTVKGMNECSSHPNIQAIIQPFLDSGPVLGYYLNNEMYKQIDRIQAAETTYDDYFMIYGDYLRENYQAVQSDLALMEDNLAQTLFEGSNFEQITSRIEEAFGTVTPGQPVLLEKYSPHNNVRTMIVLMKYQHETGETIVLSAVNCILVKRRLITLAYYIAYRGGESFEGIKQKNNEAVKRLMEAN